MYHGNKPATHEMAQAAMQQMAFEAGLNVTFDPDNIDNTDFADMTSAEPAGALFNAAPEDMAKLATCLLKGFDFLSEGSRRLLQASCACCYGIMPGTLSTAA